MRNTDTGEQQTEVVVDLGDGADRGPWITRRRLLVDRDCWRQALDEIDVGLIHLPKKLAGVGAQAFDVASLPFRINGVERKARLAGPRQSGENDQAIAREVDRNIAQVVFAGATNDEPIRHKTAYRTGVRLVLCARHAITV